MAKRQHAADDDHDDPYAPLADGLDDGPGFERIRRSGDKKPTPKGDRRQQDKEWGKMHSKFSKQRSKLGNKKP
jgi:hypothetical protein